MRCIAAARSSGCPPSRRSFSTACISISRSPARASRRTRRRAWARSSRGWPACRRSSARTCWPTKPPYELVLRDERDLAGLPELVRHAAREAAIERGKPDAWVITLSRSLIVPFLTFSDRRDLREQAFLAWTRRGENDGRARQPSDRARDPRAAPRAGDAARPQDLRGLRARRPDGRHAGRGRPAARPRVGPGEGQGAAGARRAARARAVARREHPDRAVGLALLRGKGAQGALRFRRSGAEALFPARPDARTPRSIARTGSSASASCRGRT